MLKKKLGHFQRTFYPKNVTKLSKISVWYPGVKKAPDPRSRIPDPDPQKWNYDQYGVHGVTCVDGILQEKLMNANQRLEEKEKALQNVSNRVEPSL